ncbi:MAG: DNA mismatch repair protein MutS [candidate division WOR-3 bacterium]
MKEKDVPILKQYKEIKSNFNDSILLFRMGDFYETFYDDAKFIASVLNITLTSREYGEEKIPLAGFPIKSADHYIRRLVSTGKKIAIADQLEEPSKNVKLVKRGVVEVITPGTIMRESLLSEKENNYFALVYAFDGKTVVSTLDISTGDLLVYDFKNGENIFDFLKNKDIKEIVSNEKFKIEEKEVKVIDKSFFDLDDCLQVLKTQFGIEKVERIKNLDEKLIRAAGALLLFIKEAYSTDLQQVKNFEYIDLSKRMILDSQTLRNLEIFTRSNGEYENSFLFAIDRTKTPMGGRTLREVLKSPYNDLNTINIIYDNIERMILKFDLVKSIGTLLSEVGDVERINARIASKRATPRDLVNLKKSLKGFIKITDIVKDLSIEIFEIEKNVVEKVIQLIDISIDENVILDGEKEKFFKKGFDQEYDRLKELSLEGSKAIFMMEDEEKKRTGINNLRIGYSTVMGYYIEITNSNLDKVPKDYIRKQTLKNAERFVNEKLKQYEIEILTAEERLNKLEKELYEKLIERLSLFYVELKKVSIYIGRIDLLYSYTVLSYENDYTRPLIGDFYELYIEDGRHPVIEMVNRNERFIPNSLYMDEKRSLILLTGPNMSGKSTYLRQNALIILMAHMGLFVPAKKAKIPLTDRIFTRIGASDDLSKGVSTFMAEMLECSNIIENMTEKSFIVLDEIGRGTSTFDGLSIAWAIIEYIHDLEKSPKTLFATHYHELTELRSKLPKMFNMTAKVRKYEDKIVFLKKIVEGSSDESYGIEVAKMAGLPSEIIENASQILLLLKESEMNVKEKMRVVSQLSLFKSDGEKEKFENIIRMISEKDLNNITPIESLLFLNEIKNKIEELKD